MISLAHTVAEEGEGWFAELAQRPPVKNAVAAYQRAHDTVVATPAYSKCGHAACGAALILKPDPPTYSCSEAVHGGQSGLVWRQKSWLCRWPSRINRTMLIATLYIRCQLTPDAHIRRAMELGEGTLARVHDSAIYKSLLPLVGPFTEPAVKRLLDSPTFQVGHCMNLCSCAVFNNNAPEKGHANASSVDQPVQTRPCECALQFGCA